MIGEEVVFTVRIISEEIFNLLQGKVITPQLVCKIVVHLLKLVETDPISEKMYQLCRIEIDNAETIMREIEYEKDQNGAVQRCLTHLELAFGIMKEHYSSELSKFKNMLFQSFTNGMPWIYSKESQNIYNDLVKIAFYQMTCHKMLGNKDDKLLSVINQIPSETDYSFGAYTEAVKKFLGEVQFQEIWRSRRKKFITDVKFWADMIAKPHTATVYDMSVKMGRLAFKGEKPASFRESAFVDYLREKLDPQTVIALIGDSHDDAFKFKIF